MGLFYKYKCRKCGKRYFELPINCDNCGTELIFFCPCDYIPNPKPSKNCEEINEFVISFHKSKREKELEEKINGLNFILVENQEKFEELRKEKIESDVELRKVQHEKFSFERENIGLSNEIFKLKILLERYKRMADFDRKISIPKDTIEAVRYAMKHAHPDNGGNAEDFIRFKKCYEGLTNGRG